MGGRRRLFRVGGGGGWRGGGGVWWVAARRSAGRARPCSRRARPCPPAPGAPARGAAPALSRARRRAAAGGGSAPTAAAAAQAVGGAERDAAHDAVAELLLDLEGETLLDQRIVAALFEDQRVVDVGHLLAREFDVDHGTDRLDDGAFSFSLCLCHWIPYTAAAPPTISESSLVMFACRFLL